MSSLSRQTSNALTVPNDGYAIRCTHACLIGVLKYILKDIGIPDIAVITKARVLRASDASRPGDVVVLDTFFVGRHLVLDAVVTFV